MWWFQKLLALGYKFLS